MLTEQSVRRMREPKQSKKVSLLSLVAPTVVLRIIKPSARYEHNQNIVNLQGREFSRIFISFHAAVIEVRVVYRVIGALDITPLK